MNAGPAKGFSLRNTTPFPNVLLDEVMPILKDTEWRLLCVIVRQTLGQHDLQTKKRKTRDWLTRSQLRQRTGRDSEALSHALNALVERGYIEVQTEAGRVLKTATQRRQAHGKLFYGLATLWYGRVMTGVGQEPGIQERKSELELKKQPFGSSVYRQPSPKTEHRGIGKPNATKESTKEKLTKESAPKTNTTQPARDFIELFKKTAREYLEKEPDTVLWVGDWERLRELLSKNGAMGWTPVLRCYFESDWEYVKQHRFSLAAFLNTFHILLLKNPPAVMARADASSVPIAV
jgi:hypothetical protein